MRRPRISYDAVAKIELSNGTATPAECFVTKYEDGYPWDGTAKHLKCLDYLDSVTRLVVLDTWLRNTDRQFVQGKQVHRNNSNVFFARLPRSKWCSLIAMDFSQLLIPLWPRFDLANADQLAHDPGVYGLFPEFAQFLRRAPLEDAIGKMLATTERDLREVLEAIPDSWGADDESREATARFLDRRAKYLGETLVERLEQEAPQLRARTNNGETDAK